MKTPYVVLKDWRKTAGEETRRYHTTQEGAAAQALDLAQINPGSRYFVAKVLQSAGAAVVLTDVEDTV